MPIATSCPSCKALFRLPNDTVGRTVRCQKCASLFVVPRSEEGTATPGLSVSSEAPPMAIPVAAEATAPPVEPVDDTEPPVTIEEVEEEEKIEPTKKAKRPEPTTPKDRPTKPAGANPGLIALSIVLVTGGLLACLVCSGATGYWYFSQPAAIAVAFDNKNEFQSDQFLDERDPRNHATKIHKLYVVQFEAGRTYHIDLMSNQFDAYLYLIDDANRVVSENDDGGDRLNSRIVFRAPRTGQYRIHATSLNGQRTGNFRLLVRRM